MHHLRPACLSVALALPMLLAACASGPSDTLSIIPPALEQETRKDGVFTQPNEWERTRPGCTGECPKLTVQSLVFPGHPDLTRVVDHALATMTWLEQDSNPPYQDLQGYEAYYWQNAGPRDETILRALPRYRNAQLTVLELDAGLYATGMAHGIQGTQFLNWDHAQSRLLTLDDLLAPGALPAYQQVLRAAHAQWLRGFSFAQDDPAGYQRMWPFVASDNVALTDTGLVVKYQPYEIAPYAAGQPELHIPYDRLSDILKPRFLPAQ